MTGRSNPTPEESGAQQRGFASREKQRACELILVARALSVDALMPEVLSALSGASVEHVLLKGPAIAAWLYRPDESRPYVDADLLIKPQHLATAEDVLRGLGFRSMVRDYEDGRRLEHDSLWVREGTGVTIDLHRTLPRVRGMSPEWVWRHLWPRTHEISLPAPGGTVRVLDEPALALLVALHAAHHVGHSDLEIQPIADLRRALAKLDLQVWREAFRLAEALRAGPQMSRGLHATAEGSELAAALGLPAPSSEENEAAGFERLAASRTAWGRARLLVRVLIPSPSYLRWSSRLARSGRVGFLLAYLTHPFVTLFHAPRGYRVWRQSRRAARED